MPSATFEVFARAILARNQLTFMYGGHYRETCPHILGHKAGREAALVYQFGGASNGSLPAKGEWRCFYLAGIKAVGTRGGRWHGGSSHQKPQTCVDIVYLDVDPDVPNQPGRRRDSK
jgi:hypothetical protein